MSAASKWLPLVMNEWPTHGAYAKSPRPDSYPSLDRSPTILGIHDGHTSSACVLRQGRLVSAVEEERLTRVKNQSGFPRQAIQHALELAGIGTDEVDLIAWGTELMSLGSGSREERKQHYLGRIPLAARMRSRAALAIQHVAGRKALQAVRRRAHTRRRAARLTQLAQIGLDPSKVRFVEHHQCHAATAYYGWGRLDRDVLVLTNDGQGDGLCATVSVGSRGRMYRLAEVTQEHSFGNLYGMVTFVLGMVPLEHEFKVMGMAPYAGGERTEAVRDIFWRLFEDDPRNPLGWRKKLGSRSLMDYEHVRSQLELHRFDNVCGGLQRFTEEIMTRWARRAIGATGIGDVCCAGGVFMNVKANQALSVLPDVREFFVFPSCADETICIGAAYQIAADYHASQSETVGIEPIRDLYLGRDYSEEEIEAALGAFQFEEPVEVVRSERIEADVAELLAAGHVVARFSGREEFGARALGNRSLLADPRNEDTIRVINEMIKQRDFWMPFAMSVLPDRVDDYIRNEKRIDAPYMILTFDCRPERMQEIRAAIHPYDRTSRPQVVHESWNPSYYKILKEYERRTGSGALLNTSFNLHGYPLVSHPVDALTVFRESGLTHLAIGPFLARKTRFDRERDRPEESTIRSTVR